MAGAILLAASPAHATGRDFVDETLVATGLGGRELGLELGADLRVDRDYRLQGWFTAELEAGITRAWLIEGVTSFVDRGRGLELGVWRAETRYVLLEQPRWPVALALSAEYESELRAAKHPALERIVKGRAIFSRTFARSILATMNWGLARRAAPITKTAPVVALGARYPEGGAVMAGFEWRKDSLERETRFGPEIRIALPHEMTLRLGGITGYHHRLYRFIGRAILETELHGRDGRSPMRRTARSCSRSRRAPRWPGPRGRRTMPHAARRPLPQNKRRRGRPRRRPRAWRPPARIRRAAARGAPHGRSPPPSSTGGICGSVTTSRSRAWSRVPTERARATGTIASRR